LPSSIVLSFMPGIHAGRALKSLTVRHTRSIGALMTVLTWIFGIATPAADESRDNCALGDDGITMF
jgi:hypothetical protein